MSSRRRGVDPQGSTSDSNEEQMQIMVEKVLTSDLFMNKLMEVMSTRLPAILNKQLKAYEEKVNSLEERVDHLEQLARGNNLRIYGVLEDEKDDSTHKSDTDLLVEIVNSKMGLSIQASDLEYCFRMKQGNRGPRPQMVRFNSKEKRDSLFRNKAKLKGTRIVVREDLTPRRYKLLTTSIDALGNTNVWSDGGQVKAKFKGKVYKIKTVADVSKLH